VWHDTLTRVTWLIHDSSIWHPLKMQHPRYPPNPETQIFQYKFKLNQNFNCTARYQGIWVYRFGGFWGCSIFSGNCNMWHAPLTWHDSCMCDMTHACVTCLLNMSHGPDNWECSRVICEWVTSHMLRKCVTNMNKSCHTYVKVMWHIWRTMFWSLGVLTGHMCVCACVCVSMWMSHVTHVKELCHTYD